MYFRPVQMTFMYYIKDGEDDILLPAIKDCVKNVNIEEGTITVHLLNGLRDINKK